MQAATLQSGEKLRQARNHGDSTGLKIFRDRLRYPYQVPKEMMKRIRNTGTAVLGGDESPLFANDGLDFFDGIRGASDKPGKDSIQHRQIIEVITCGKCLVR